MSALERATWKNTDISLVLHFTTIMVHITLWWSGADDTELGGIRIVDHVRHTLLTFHVTTRCASFCWNYVRVGWPGCTRASRTYSTLQVYIPCCQKDWLLRWFTHHWYVLEIPARKQNWRCEDQGKVPLAPTWQIRITRCTALFEVTPYSV